MPTMHVELGKIREFAAAAHSQTPEYYTGEVIPPTFLWIASTFWAHPDNGAQDPGLDITRVLHAEQSFRFHGEPPAAGSELRIATRLGERTVKEGGRGGTLTFVPIITEFHDVSGKLVAESTTTLVQTGHAPTEAKS